MTKYGCSAQPGELSGKSFEPPEGLYGEPRRAHRQEFFESLLMSIRHSVLRGPVRGSPVV